METQFRKAARFVSSRYHWACGTCLKSNRRRTICSHCGSVIFVLVRGNTTSGKNVDKYLRGAREALAELTKDLGIQRRSLHRLISPSVEKLGELKEYVSIVNEGLIIITGWPLPSGYLPEEVLLPRKKMGKGMKKERVIQVRVESHLHEWIRAKSEASGVSITAIVTTLLNEYKSMCEEKERQADPAAIQI